MRPRYEKQAKNGAWIIPQTTSTTSPTAIALKKIRAPPTTKARSRSPRRQAVIVASTKKMTNKSRLSWATKIQDQRQCPHAADTPCEPGSPGTEIEPHEHHQ